MMRGRRGADERVREAVRAARPPQEREALERAVVLARSEQDARSPLSGQRSGRKLGAALVAAAAAAALVLTPAGADVRGWVADAIDDDPPVERKALTRLPAGGEVLVTSPQGAWLVAEDGSRRLLGAYGDATFSPSGAFIAATRGNQLVATEPDGSVRWTISRREPITDPRWAPSGFRVAFLEGEALWVMPADASSTPQVLAAAKPTAPSWRPPAEGSDPRLAPNVLTYAESRSVVTRDVDTGEVLWRHATPRRVKWIVWAGANRLAVADPSGIRIFDRDGKPLQSPPVPPRTRVDSLAASPDGERLAIVLEDAQPGPSSRSRLFLARIAGGDRLERTVFSGLGTFGTPVFSPRGDRILLPWPDADQWLFINPSEDRKLLRRVVAVGDISRQFDPGGRGRSVAPTVAGWCCDD